MLVCRQKIHLQNSKLNFPPFPCCSQSYCLLVTARKTNCTKMFICESFYFEFHACIKMYQSPHKWTKSSQFPGLNHNTLSHKNGKRMISRSSVLFLFFTFLEVAFLCLLGSHVCFLHQGMLDDSACLVEGVCQS